MSSGATISELMKPWSHHESGGSSPAIRFLEAEARAVHRCKDHIPNGVIKYSSDGKVWRKCAKCPAFVEGGVDKTKAKDRDYSVKLHQRAYKAMSKAKGIKA